MAIRWVVQTGQRSIEFRRLYSAIACQDELRRNGAAPDAQVDRCNDGVCVEVYSLPSTLPVAAPDGTRVAGELEALYSIFLDCSAYDNEHRIVPDSFGDRIQALLETVRVASPVPAATATSHPLRPPYLCPFCGNTVYYDEDHDCQSVPDEAAADQGGGEG